MPAIPCLQIDAFTDRPFGGNPAAVCLLDKPAAATWMQKVAAEMNLSETAFVSPSESGFALRWFTPTVEVDLCGHATLASAYALWSEGLVDMDVPIPFHTRSGVLTCRSAGDLIELDLPATPAEETEPPPGLLEALGARPTFVGLTQFDTFIVVDSEDTVRSLRPDFAALREMDVRGAIVTSRCADAAFDFVSRYFAPGAGIDEDPVTGSAHCCLGPYWGKQLDKDAMTGFQASARGGVVQVRVVGDRVVLGGRAVTVLRGALSSEATDVG